MRYPLHTLFAATIAVVANMTGNVVAGLLPDPDAGTPVPVPTGKMIESYAYTGATDTDIADRFLMDETELRNRFANVLRYSRGLRRIHLRSSQTDVAKKGNASLLVWIGRNELDQMTHPNSLTDDSPGDEEVKNG